MNKADPDCGTSFTWVTRALGPRLGWLTGWTIVAADVVVMATLAYIAGGLHVPLFGLDGGLRTTSSTSASSPRSGSSLMTWICYVGIEISARTQFVLLGDRDLHARAVRRGRALEGLRDRHTGLRPPRPQLVHPLRICPVEPPPWSTACCSASSSTGAGTAASASTRSRAIAPTAPAKRR